GAILTTEAVASHIPPGDHGSTFAGNPFVTGVAKYVLDRISQPEFLAQVRETGEYLKDRLSEINSPLIKEVRGRGLMVGLELTKDVSPVVEAGYEQGLLMVSAGMNTIRFVPPLIATKQHVDRLVERLTTILAEQA
ncbi:MAG: aminotransferase class III-fold pyridoxal phosphate-dependent enzyme, partial [Anaerolineae bacterium]|nr:aminotransferase class III-fold pyridoxal phosphate-dependent enzyme [Anaerolineae bacterium]